MKLPTPPELALEWSPEALWANLEHATATIEGYSLHAQQSRGHALASFWIKRADNPSFAISSGGSQVEADHETGASALYMAQVEAEKALREHFMSNPIMRKLLKIEEVR